MGLWSKPIAGNETLYQFDSRLVVPHHLNGFEENKTSFSYFGHRTVQLVACRHTDCNIALERRAVDVCLLNEVTSLLLGGDPVLRMYTAARPQQTVLPCCIFRQTVNLALPSGETEYNSWFSSVRGWNVRSWRNLGWLESDSNCQLPYR
jgi:hypothetical protein